MGLWGYRTRYSETIPKDYGLIGFLRGTWHVAETQPSSLVQPQPHFGEPGEITSFKY